VLWILIDLGIALLALAGLVLVGLRLWRTVRTTTTALGEANERLMTAQAALDAVQQQTPRGRA
jgi:hypothetical protein